MKSRPIISALISYPFAKLKMADHKKELEERLREVCCIGDEKNVQLLVERGVNINAPNAVNGWTPLHWAAKRGHANIVKYLIKEGVDTAVLTKKGETAAQLASDESIIHLLGADENVAVNSSNEALPIVPNYLRNPDFFYAQKTLNNEPEKWDNRERGDLHRANPKVSVTYERHETKDPSHYSTSLGTQKDDEFVLRLRIADAEETDFIEVDFDRSNMTFQNFQAVCCVELGIEAVNDVQKIRKLPNTIVRNDRDVKRLLSFQEFEVVLKKSQTK